MVLTVEGFFSVINQHLGGASRKITLSAAIEYARHDLGHLVSYQHGIRATNRRHLNAVLRSREKLIARFITPKPKTARIKLMDLLTGKEEDMLSDRYRYEESAGTRLSNAYGGISLSIWQRTVKNKSYVFKTRDFIVLARDLVRWEQNGPRHAVPNFLKRLQRCLSSEQWVEAMAFINHFRAGWAVVGFDEAWHENALGPKKDFGLPSLTALPLLKSA